MYARQLRDLGLDVRVFEAAVEQLLDCDVLCLNGRWWNPKTGRESGGYAAAAEFLERARRPASRLIWFDTEDSSGNLQAEVLGHVDRYCKQFVLRDRSAYLVPHYAGRLFADYYHREFGIVDEGEQEIRRVLPAAHELEKLCVSWNPALADYGVYARRLAKLRRRLPLPFRYSYRLTRPSARRPLAVAARLGFEHSRETIRFHRRRIVELLAQRGVHETRKVSLRQYFAELRRARVGVSPFGWGEFSFKDYEMIIAGAAVLKPDMGHLETWPDLYLPEQTYWPHRWDFSDLNERLDELLEGERARELAERAQAVFSSHVCAAQAGPRFAQRFAELVS